MPDPETVKMLNLLGGSPRFVIHEAADGGYDLRNPDQVPAGDGLYWLAGTTQLRSGAVLESVFVIDTDSGAEQCGAFWRHEGVWYGRSEIDSLLATLGISRQEFFPYSWTYHVKVAAVVHG